MRNTKHHWTIFNWLVLIALVVAGCTPAATVAPATNTAPAPTAAPATDVPPTAKPVEPTQAPAPTDVPTAAPTEHPPITLSMWSVTNGEGWLEAYEHSGEAYQAEHPYADVEVQVTTNGFEELKAQLTSGIGPDIFHTAGSRLAIAPFVEAGHMLPLTDLEFVQNAPEVVKSPWTIDGEVYGVAIDNYTGGLYYNTEIFAANDLEPPTSFPELLAACDQLQEAGLIPIAPMFADSWTTGLLATFIAGTTVMAPEPNWFSRRVQGETTFAETEGWQAVVDQTQQMTERGCFGENPTATNYGDGQAMFLAGQAAMWIQGTWAAGAMGDAGPDTYRLITFPSSEEPGGSYTAIAIGNAFNINTAGQDPEEAKQLLEFIYTNPDLVLEFAAFNGGFTLYDPNASSADQQPIFEVFVDQVYGDQIATWAADYMIGGTQVKISELLQGMMAGQLAPEEVLPLLDADWDTYQAEHPEVVDALK